MNQKEKQRKPNVKEAAILKDCLEWLAMMGYTAWRMPIGPVLRGHSKAFSPSPIRGFPDICGILKYRPGRMFTVEVKTDTGKLSDFQKQWFQRLAAAGVVTILARSPAEMAAALFKAEGGT